MSLLQTLLNENYSAQTKVKPADVQSKLSAFSKQTSNNTAAESTVFGLEDSQGGTIKVHVRDDQAKDFERALGIKLSEIDPEDPYAPEIAEILFDLRDQFDITNIEWPEIQEDEEPAEPFGDEGGDDMAMGDEDGDDMAMGDEGGDDMAMGGSPSGGSESELLQSVLQTMTADAEAKRQEALARAAEARAKEAEAAAKIADNKLKSEEEVADMEAFYDSQNAEKKEAKKLAKLAKYRHTIRQQDMETGQFNDYADAEQDQNNSSEERMDLPSGENPEGSDPQRPPTSSDSDDIDVDLDDTGFENEEVYSVSDNRYGFSTSANNAVQAAKMARDRGLSGKLNINRYSDDMLDNWKQQVSDKLKVHPLLRQFPSIKKKYDRLIANTNRNNLERMDRMIRKDLNLNQQYVVNPHKPEEDEENHVDGPQTVNRQFKDLQAAINHLHSLQVRKQVHNGQ